MSLPPGGRSRSLSYVITVSRRHLVAAQMCILSLRHRTSAPIVVVGNLDATGITLLRALGADYIDEREVDTSGRMPTVAWEKKFREIGWYRQMFFRLCIDRYATTDDVVILDSEMFAFDNWDEGRLYDPATGRPRSFYWVPSVRKPDWDYRMYRGSAYLLSGLPGLEDVMEYANSDSYHRHISGVVMFSTANVGELWRRLEQDTDLPATLDRLFNHEPELMFSDMDLYGIAADYGLFDRVVPVVMHAELLGWYDNHDDPVFNRFRVGAMWSMCQRYADYPTATAYRGFMEATAAALGARLPELFAGDLPAGAAGTTTVAPSTVGGSDHREGSHPHGDDDAKGSAVDTALEWLAGGGAGAPTLVDIRLFPRGDGAWQPAARLAGYAATVDGTVELVDASDDAVMHAMAATSELQPWIRYHATGAAAFLEACSGPIALLRIDSAGGPPDARERTLAMRRSALEAALPALADESLVLLDGGPTDRGAARQSTRFLVRNGFTLAVDGQWQLYVRGFGLRAPTRLQGLLGRSGPAVVG